MKRIVADSGPLIMFARSDLLGVLREVSGEILVPSMVFTECTRRTTKPGASVLTDAESARLMRVDRDSAVSKELHDIKGLDSGERAVLTLSHRLGCPALMDEALGRRVAARQGIPIIGSAGVLLVAKERGLVEEIGPILAAWRGWGYFLAPSLFNAVLARAGESLASCAPSEK